MEIELRQALSGDVRFDEVIRKVYSVDASVYEIEPQGVILPKTTKDIAEAIQIAAKHGVPVIPRGAATGVTGGCLGNGLIIDTSKYMNRILDIDFQKETVTCEPGVIQDDLNRALAKEGYRLGPSTSTGNRATVGGMLANNAAGAHSLLYGSTGDHVLEVELAMADGTIQIFNRTLPPELEPICTRYEQEIREHFPKIKRMSSGYYLPALLDNNMCRLLAGSEGSLGVATKITFKIVPIPKEAYLCALHFDTLENCFAAIKTLLTFNPIALEMIDREIIEAGKISPTMHSRLGWLKGDPAAVLAVEFAETPPKDFPLLSERNREDIWAIRKAGLELLLSNRSYRRAIAFIEDLTIPPSQLPQFMKEFLIYLKEKNRTAGIYGHVGEGCMHLRPFINLAEPSDRIVMMEMAQDITNLVVKYGGVMSGEHGDGLVRSWVNQKIFTPKLYQAMCEIKALYDPQNLMNPGKVVEGPPLLEHLRPSPQKSFPTFLDFREEGGFALAVDMCNGNGLCRKKESVMCPSFQATHDEYDTTRARAQALRALLLGRLKPHPDVLDVLDLCLECKGCKTECPSQVDMAKMKSELLYQVQKEQGLSLRTRLFAHIATLNRWGSKFPRLANFINALPPTRWILSLIGVTPKRSLPQYAHQRFSKWFSQYSQPEGKPVVLFNDTYCEFSEPQIGQAAVKVLNNLGYQVIVPEWTCCGRPLISKGCLPQAKEQLQHLLKTLKPYAEQGLTILFLEPSCFSVLHDDIRGLVGDHPVSKACVSLETFLAQENVTLEGKQKIQVHGHCHQKSLWGTKDLMQVLPTGEETPAGCCGCAGSFGYEKEHYQLSMKIGELKLFPSVRGAGGDEVIVANGFSCRSQIQHGTGRKAYHFIELFHNRT